MISYLSVETVVCVVLGGHFLIGLLFLMFRKSLDDSYKGKVERTLYLFLLLLGALFFLIPGIQNGWKEVTEGILKTKSEQLTVVGSFEGFVIGNTSSDEKTVVIDSVQKVIRDESEAMEAFLSDDLLYEPAISKISLQVKPEIKLKSSEGVFYYLDYNEANEVINYVSAPFGPLPENIEHYFTEAVEKMNDTGASIELLNLMLKPLLDFTPLFGRSVSYRVYLSCYTGTKRDFQYCYSFSAG